MQATARHARQLRDDRFDDVTPGNPAAFDAVRPRPDRRDCTGRDRILTRVRAEFVEMPCLRLTSAQAQRLFGLRADVCERVLDALVAEHLLYRDDDARYRTRQETSSQVPKTREPE